MKTDNEFNSYHQMASKTTRDLLKHREARLEVPHALQDLIEHDRSLLSEAAFAPPYDLSKSLKADGCLHDARLAVRHHLHQTKKLALTSHRLGMDVQALTGEEAEVLDGVDPNR